MKRLVVSLMLGLAVAVLAVAAIPAAAPARAATCATTTAPKKGLTTPDNQVQISLPFTGTDTCLDNNGKTGGAIIVYLKQVLQFISGLVGITIILMLIVAGIQYITSTGDPGMVKSAKTRVVNAMTALLLFLMMFAILQFLVPGGIL